MPDLFNVAMVAFAALMLFVAVHPRIHTGWAGAIGCVVMGLAALLATDNSSIAYVDGTKRVLLLFCAGVGLQAGNIMWMVFRATKPVERFKHPLRRRTDFDQFNDTPELQHATKGSP